MSTKSVKVAILTVVGIYFLIFHTAPFPFNHEAIGLPPYHVLHTIVGVLFLVAAVYWAKRR